MAEKLTSNHGRYTYRLTKNSLWALGSPQYRLYRNDLAAAGRPPSFYESGRVIKVFRVKTGDPYVFYYFFRSNGRLQIGCRVFNLPTTAKILRWAGVSR
jgi:hypothetical protein